MSPEQSADLEMQELAEKAENFKHGMVHISREKKAMLGNPWLYGSKSGNAACLAAKRVVMVAGGTGITPMLQALHAILGTPGDRTRVTLLYSNRAQSDILARATLEAWQAEHPRRLDVVHTLKREPADSGCAGARGRIDKALLQGMMFYARGGKVGDQGVHSNVHVVLQHVIKKVAYLLKNFGPC